MASSWIVLHAGEIIECDKCREAVEIARRRNLIRQYNVPLASVEMVGDMVHASVVVSLMSDGSGVLVNALCGSPRFYLGFRRVFRWNYWRRGWRRPDVQQYLELMALANESGEKVWRDWQQAIMMTVLGGDEKWQRMT